MIRSSYLSQLSSQLIVSLCLVFSGIFMFTTFISHDVAHASTVSEAKEGVNKVGGSGNGTASVKQLITTVVNILLFLTGSFAVIMIIIAGFRLVTANGDSNTVSSAKNTIIYAVIGIVVAVSAYAIVNFILSQVA